MKRKKGEWEKKGWGKDLVFLYAAAEQLEANDQGGLARLLRVAGEFMTRRAAFEMDLSSNPELLEETLQEVQEIFSRRRLGSRWDRVLNEGLKGLLRGEKVEIDDSPLPLVCRRCGGRYLPKI